MHHRMEQQTAAYEEFRARVSDREERIARVRANAVQVGDRLPPAPLSGHRGEESLDSLVRRGYRYLYLYRPDCKGCMDLAPAWRALTPGAVGKIAFIAYRPGVDLPFESSDHHFALRGAQAKQLASLTEFVPAMIVLREDGYVLGVADGFEQMLRQLRLHGIVDPHVLEEFATRREAGAQTSTAVPGAK